MHRCYPSDVCPTHYLPQAMFINDVLSPVVKDVPVWIVEDHRDYRETIEDLINQSAGMYCPNTFSTCEALFEAFHVFPETGIMLMDIGLPPGGMSGIEGVQKMSEKAPHIKIVMLTIHSDDDKIFRAICAGASGYLLKLSTPEEIVSGIREAHSGGVAMTRQIALRVLEMFRQFSTPAADHDLTKREVQVLQLLVDGLTKKEIADRLFIAYTTVDSHVQHIYAKLHVHSATQAVKKALEERLV